MALSTGGHLHSCDQVSTLDSTVPLFEIFVLAKQPLSNSTEASCSIWKQLHSVDKCGTSSGLNGQSAKPQIESISCTTSQFDRLVASLPILAGRQFSKQSCKASPLITRISQSRQIITDDDAGSGESGLSHDDADAMIMWNRAVRRLWHGQVKQAVQTRPNDNNYISLITNRHSTQADTHKHCARSAIAIWRTNK